MAIFSGIWNNREDWYREAEGEGEDPVLRGHAAVWGRVGGQRNLPPQCQNGEEQDLELSSPFHCLSYVNSPCVIFVENKYKVLISGRI